jgi:hypothetical protein
MSIFAKEKLNLQASYKRIGLFCLVEVSEFGHSMGVGSMRISTFFNGNRVNSEPYSEELYNEKIRKNIPIIILEDRPEEYEQEPPNKLILGRLELPRIGLLEEELG